MPDYRSICGTYVHRGTDPISPSSCHDSLVFSGFKAAFPALELIQNTAKHEAGNGCERPAVISPGLSAAPTPPLCLYGSRLEFQPENGTCHLIFPCSTAPLMFCSLARVFGEHPVPWCIAGLTHRGIKPHQFATQPHGRCDELRPSQLHSITPITLCIPVPTQGSLGPCCR